MNLRQKLWVIEVIIFLFLLLMNTYNYLFYEKIYIGPFNPPSNWLIYFWLGIFILNSFAILILLFKKETETFK